ncbi:MAG TPA: hypothetical protein PLU10_09940 [Chitinophagaceae bacterium]|nr:hypothetical protein [Chitinophagaceae bacterium]
MKQLLLLFIAFFCPILLWAQVPTLPAMNIETNNAQNKLSFFCQYDGVKSIAIQRSADSVRNFTTIGVLTAPKKGNLSYTDTRPVVGKNYYRVSVEFQGDIEWFSNTYKVMLDSATLAKSLNESIKSGTTNAKDVKANDGTAPVSTDFYFTPSSRIYTNPYTGHVNLNLPDALNKRYNIRFLEPSKKEVLRISRVNKTMLILDKNNFNARGTYQFELYDGTELVETGYVTIY